MLGAAVRRIVFGNALPAHRICSAFYVGRRGVGKKFLSFGTQSSFVSILRAAADVAGHGDDAAM